MVQVRVREPSIEISKSDCGLVNMLEARAPNRIQNANSRQKRHRIARRG